MIPSRETVEDAAARTGFEPWPLEIVLRLRDLLQSIRSDSLLDACLVLKGGTPLNLCFGTPPRLSVDLDFNFVGALDREAMLAARPDVEASLERVARRGGYRAQWSRPEHAGRRAFLRYASVLGGDATIVIDLNFLHRVPLAGVQELAIWDPGVGDAVTAKVVSTPELVGGKLVALVDRCLPRDLYDAARAFQRPELSADQPVARRLFIAMSGMLDRPLSGYSLARLNRLTDRDVQRELHPLLRSDDRAGVEMLRSAVTPVLDSWLTLSDAEREYTERLQAGDLRPELLFPSDPEMARRLRQHPALLWKAENARQHAARGGGRSKPPGQKDTM